MKIKEIFAKWLCKILKIPYNENDYEYDEDSEVMEGAIYKSFITSTKDGTGEDFLFFDYESFKDHLSHFDQRITDDNIKTISEMAEKYSNAELTPILMWDKSNEVLYVTSKEKLMGKFKQ